MEIVLTEGVRRTLRQAVTDSRREGREVGGSLLACDGPGCLIVAGALPAGPGAHAGPAHLRTDAGFQNRAIARLRRRWPALRYVGDWHTHLMHLPRLSSQDLRTARAILDDPGGPIEELLLVVGTPGRDGAPLLVGFRAARDGEGVRVEELALGTVADDGEEVRRALGGPLPPAAELLAEPGPEAPEEVAHGGAERILRDLLELRRELRAEATLRCQEELLAAVVRYRNREAVVVFPPEYPLGAPQVFAGSLDRGPLRPVPLRYGWSSLHRLVDPVELALRDGGRSDGARFLEGPLRRWLRLTWPLAALVLVPLAGLVAARLARAEFTPEISRLERPAVASAEVRAGGAPDGGSDPDVPLGIPPETAMCTPPGDAQPEEGGAP